MDVGTPEVGLVATDITLARPDPFFLGHSLWSHISAIGAISPHCRA